MLASFAGSVFASEDLVAQRYRQLFFDYENAGQCGLVTEQVQRAFVAKRKHLEGLSNLSAEQLTRLRIKGIAASDLEYDNRGLGGYRPWCKGDVKRGVLRILAPPPSGD